MITNWFVKSSRNKNGTGKGSTPAYRIGDRVQSGSFGKGVVRAYNPDGTVTVRFDGQIKSRSIFPSFLEKFTQH